MLAFNKTPMLLKRFERDCGVVPIFTEAKRGLKIEHRGFAKGKDGYPPKEIVGL